MLESSNSDWTRLNGTRRTPWLPDRQNEGGEILDPDVGLTQGKSETELRFSSFYADQTQTDATNEYSD